MSSKFLIIGTFLFRFVRCFAMAGRARLTARRCSTYGGAESIIKEILRIDGSRSCFDFTTVFATLLGWDSSRRRLRVLALPSKPRGIFANLAKSPRDHRPMLAAIKTRTGRSKASPRDESADP
jgi:hypothetical protein